MEKRRERIEKFFDVVMPWVGWGLINFDETIKPTVGRIVRAAEKGLVGAARLIEKRLPANDRSE